MKDSLKLKFVALGNSLTVGFIPYNSLQHHEFWFPYTEFLKEILSDKLSNKGLNHLKVSIVNRGVNGDTTRGMLRRFDEQVAQESPDYVIIWGGINDIFGMRAPEEIMLNLNLIFERTRGVGAKPIACTVTSVLGFDHLIPLIIKLNSLIKEHCGKRKLPVVDLFRATSDKSGRLMEAYSSDGVHLTRKGYEKIAFTLYSDIIEPILEEFSGSRKRSACS